MIIDWDGFSDEERPDVVVSSNELVTSPKLIKVIQKCGLKILDMPIPIGDYIVRGSPNVIIERKKVGDWLQSQRDGRMYSQKKDMMEGVNGAIPVIIIHGHFKNVAGYSKRWKPQQVCGTLANTIFSDIQHISVPDMEWFARTLKSIFNLVNQSREWKPRPVTLQPRQTKNEEWGLNVLMAADKVGPVAARKLAMQFDTVVNAVNASRELLQQTIGDATGARFYEIINTPLEGYCRERLEKSKQ